MEDSLLINKIERQLYKFSDNLRIHENEVCLPDTTIIWDTPQTFRITNPFSFDSKNLKVNLGEVERVYKSFTWIKYTFLIKALNTFWGGVLYKPTTERDVFKSLIHFVSNYTVWDQPDKGSWISKTNFNLDFKYKPDTYMLGHCIKIKLCNEKEHNITRNGFFRRKKDEYLNKVNISFAEVESRNSNISRHWSFTIFDIEDNTMADELTKAIVEQQRKFLKTHIAL